MHLTEISTVSGCNQFRSQNKHIKFLQPDILPRIFKVAACLNGIFRSFSCYDTYVRTPLINKRSVGHVFSDLQKIAF